MGFLMKTILLNCKLPQNIRVMCSLAYGTIGRNEHPYLGPMIGGKAHSSACRLESFIGFQTLFPHRLQSQMTR